MPAELLAFGLAAALAAEPAAPAEGREPPVALLEFLGTWTTDEGRWIDPEVLDAMPEAGGSDTPEASGAAPRPAPGEEPTAKGGAEDGQKAGDDNGHDAHD
jgi:hypothetical protein